VITIPRCIDEFEIKNKNVFIRVDFNVPVESLKSPSQDKPYKIKDPTRILAALPTLQYAIQQGARVILCSHFGRPAQTYDPAFSLKPVGEYLSEILGQEVYFSESCVGMGIKKLLSELPPHSVLLLENIRFHKEEKTEDVHFYHQLASYIDIYINDAFGASHREHASITGIPKIVKEKGIGFLVKKELMALNQLIYHPKRPFWLLLGGAKVSDKIDMIKKILANVNGLCVGGAMAYPFLVAQGFRVGNSKCEHPKVEFAKHLIESTWKQNIQLLLPEDHVVAKFDASEQRWKDPRVVETADIPEGFSGIDIGPRSRTKFENALAKAKQIFWNGPLGVYEELKGREGSARIAKFLATLKPQGVDVVVGGGDSAATVHELGLDEEFFHVSTGGGAALTYIETGNLPGLVPLQSSPKLSEGST
jgi:phosphoglycerate kinase